MLFQNQNINAGYRSQNGQVKKQVQSGWQSAQPARANNPKPQRDPLRDVIVKSNDPQLLVPTTLVFDGFTTTSLGHRVARFVAPGLNPKSFFVLMGLDANRCVKFVWAEGLSSSSVIFKTN